MDAGVQQFTKFISGEIILVIPVYQRNYDWKTANCEQLFNDIVRIIKTGKPHFIGTFVYQYKPTLKAPQEYIIIDGQQRITSIILFAKALYDLTDDAELQTDIKAKFLKHSTGRALKNKCRLRPTEYDLVTFEKIMEDTFDENNFSADEKNSALYCNYRFFRDKVSVTTISKEDLCDAINQLNVVSILLQDEKPQEIFESLNSTGLDLTKADLIRNFLLMPLKYDAQEELYKNYWLKIEELLRPSGNVENFLVQYLIAKRKSDSVMENKKQRLSNRNLYVVFKEYFAENYNNAEACLEDLYHYAKYFNRVLFNDNTKFENLTPLDKKFYELTFLLKANNAPIILMYLINRYEQKHFDEATFIKFVDALISLTFRAKVCGHAGINPQFAGNVLARLDRENPLNENSFWRILTFGKGTYAFPNDKDFQKALMTNNLYETIKPNLCKYLLYSLERAARGKELPAYSEATVEHVLPQKLSDSWKKYLKERNDSQTQELWLHTLGNLTLTAYNQELGNRDFDAKKKIYAESGFHYTRSLKDYLEWTSKQIQTRAQKLADAAIKIWTLPEEFRFVNLDDTFNLDSDFGALRGTKPACVSIFETEIKISNWIDLVREIVKQLYARDKDIFRQIAKNENLPRKNKLFSADPKQILKPFKVDEDYYMETVFRTGECLKTVKILVENFDRLGDTNFKEDIYFTLRR